MSFWTQRSERNTDSDHEISKSVRDAVKALIIALPDVPSEHHRSLYMVSQVAIGGHYDVDRIADHINLLAISSLSQDRASQIAAEICDCARYTSGELADDQDNDEADYSDSDHGDNADMEAVGTNGKFTISDDQLTISRKGSGLLTMLNLGLQGDKVIPLHQITAVELRKPGFARGYLRLSINGRDPIGGLTEAIRDENALLLDRKHYAQAEKLKDALLASITAKQRPSLDAAVSVADELIKLADLRSKGVLTDAEFATEKAKLLRR